MNVYLLPHHRLDPRFRYTLEREALPADAAAAATSSGMWRRTWTRIVQWYRKLKTDYDQVVHGHEQIRLSRLVLMMDRDPNLTLVIPAGMSRESAMEAVRGVVRCGLMALRSHVVRNVITALVMMIVLFGATPTHIAAVIFYPLIALYAWGRYWEDRLIRRRMNHLLEVRMTQNGREHFREEQHLARLEDVFRETPQPSEAYLQAVSYLDGLHNSQDGLPAPEHALMFKYYSDVGRLDPYERYQDRIRKKLVETAKLVAHHLWSFWKGAFWWSIGTSRIVVLRVPNLLFVLIASVAAGYGVIVYLNWKAGHGETFPQSVHAAVEFESYAKLTIDVRPVASQQPPEDGDNSVASPVTTSLFDVICPLDSSRIKLWSEVISDMIAKHEKHREGSVRCPGGDGETDHAAKFKIKIRY